MADRLGAQGHTVLWAVKDVIGSAPRLAPTRARFLQAPVRPPSGEQELPVSLADVLTRLGFGDASNLDSMLKAWIDLLELARPDVLLADYAPTALLAARATGLPAASFGNGFEIPPAGLPLPSLQPWRTMSDADLVKAEAPILETVNAVLSGRGTPPFRMLSDLFHGDETLLCCFPEFDHYGPRVGADYVGPVLETPPAPAAPGEVAARSRSFFYLSGQHPFTRPMLEFLGRSGEPALGYVRDMDEADRTRFSTLSLRISDMPLDMDEMLATARLVIGHAGAGATQAAILNGIPLLMLPHTVEQGVLAYRIGYAGLGVPLLSQKHMASVGHLLKRARQPDVYERVGAVAARYAGFDPAAQGDAIARRCLSLLRG